MTSPEGNTQTTENEIRRLFALPDRWLAVTLLRLSRGLRTAIPDISGNPASDEKIPFLLWHLIPEVCRRLSDLPLSLNEGTRPDLRYASPQTMRYAVGLCLRNATTPLVCAQEPTEFNLGLLLRKAEKGNPVAIAIDRVVPPGSARDRDDVLAEAVRQECRRTGHPERGDWHPDLLEPRGAEIVVFGRRSTPPE